MSIPESDWVADEADEGDARGRDARARDEIPRYADWSTRHPATREPAEVQRSADWYADDGLALVPPAPGVGDPLTAPPPSRCGACETPMPWAWWPGRVGAPGLRDWPGRWCPPPALCLDCRATVQQADADRSAQERQRQAQIPARYRGLRLTREGMTRQQIGESDADFRARVRAATGTIGVGETNAQAWVAIARWKPSPGQGLWIEGPVGTGKTLAAAAIAARLLGETRPAISLEISEEELRERWGDRWEAARHTSAGRRVDPGSTGWGVLWTDERDLVERQELASTLDRDPKRQVADAPLLVYDDLGSELGATHKRADYARDLLTRLVRYRYDRRLPWIVTSNLSIDQLGDPATGKRPGAGLDERTVDRIREMTPRIVCLVGDSWRAA